MILKIDWSEFQDEVRQFIKKGNEIIETHKAIRTQEELAQFNAEKSIWENNAIKYVSNCFDPIDRSFSRDFKPREYQTGVELDIRNKIRNKLNSLKGQIRHLEYLLVMLNVADAVVRPNEVDLEARKNFDVEQTLNFILSKLYDLYPDGRLHSLKWILENNGIDVGNRNEEWDYSKMLERSGYIQTQNGSEVLAKLTLEGKFKIEQAHKARSTDYSKITNSDKELHKKLDFIIQELEKRGFADEIIFAEIEELRDEIPIKDKKKFGQYMKGKLIDLVVSKMINAAMASDIFRAITGEILPLN